MNIRHDVEPTILMHVDSHRGYSPDQIEDTMTLAQLLEAVQEAIEDFGEDARIVLSNGQRHGAGYGRLDDSDLFTHPDQEDDYY